MSPQPQQNRFRALTGTPWVAIVLAFLVAAQTAVAMPHAHSTDHDSMAVELVELVELESTAVHAAHEDHRTHGTPEPAVDSGADPESRDCCEIECQDCTMGSCSSLTQSRGPGLFNGSRDSRFHALDRLAPEPMASDLYRPPISR